MTLNSNSYFVIQMKITNHIFFLSIMAFVIISFPLQPSFSESVDDEKLQFASAIEETLGHFSAIEKNLDQKNFDLALVHATHPISELYDIMKPDLSEHNHELDSQVRQTLIDLQKVVKEVSREDAQKAIDEARNIMEKARMEVVGEQLSNDVNFKLLLIRQLVETSEHEYEEAVTDGEIVEIVEYQDASAFVAQANQIFDTIKSNTPERPTEEIKEFFSQLSGSIKNLDTHSQVEVYVDGINHEIDEITGNSNEDNELTHYVENIRSLLSQTKTEYTNGNNDLALSLSTKAYLDNFEYLEAPLVDAGEKELMEEIETMMRIELRDLIKNNASQEEVNNLVDTILIKMDTVAVIVPEFGTVVLIVLVAGIVSTILLSRTKINFLQKI